MTLKKKTAIITEKCIAPDIVAYAKDKYIADKFNEYFTDIGQTTCRQITKIK